MTTHVISYISQVCYCWNLYHLYPPVQMYTGTARKSEPEGLRGIWTAIMSTPLTLIRTAPWKCSQWFVTSKRIKTLELQRYIIVLIVCRKTRILMHSIRYVDFDWTSPNLHPLNTIHTTTYIWSYFIVFESYFEDRFAISIMFYCYSSWFYIWNFSPVLTDSSYIALFLCFRSQSTVWVTHCW